MYNQTTPQSQRIRIYISAIIGSVAGLFTSVMQHIGWSSDLLFAHCSLQRLLAGIDPYSCPTYGWPSNPLTTSLALLPFAWASIKLTSAIVIAISSALLAYGMLAKQEYWRLITFLSFPYIYAIVYVQWTPLFLAALFLPWLYPIVLIKPHIGMPMGIMYFTWRRALITLALGAISFIVLPDWPWRWLPQTKSYDGFIPLLVLPFGPLLALALLRWRDPQSRWLMLFSLAPQRLWYDQLLLWYLPQSKRVMIYLTILSWISWSPYLLWDQTKPIWSIIALYLPMLGVVLWPQIQPAIMRWRDQIWQPKT